MPLSEDEQRILRQIEEQLQRDPGFGRNLHQPAAGNRRALMLWSSLTILCLAATVLLLSVSAYLSFVAFVGAVFTLLLAERQVRTFSEAGLHHISDSVRGRFGTSPPRPGVDR